MFRSWWPLFAAFNDLGRMKRSPVFFLTPWLAVALLLGSCGSDDARLKGGVEGLIPAPQSVTLGGRPFECEGILRVEWPAEWGAEQAVVQAWLEDAGIALDSSASPTLRFSLSGPEAVGEAYQIAVESALVTVESASAEGLFRGWTTLRKMLPWECETGCPEGFVLPGVRVEDAPVLEHRGLLLDGCRHFQDVAFVKKQIDVLALHGMNVLHWHLTEDQGWRIEIASMPELTEVGAWRKEADGSRHGGFYSKEDIREVVAYAAARHIEVIPEVEMPGHSSAALAAYPSLGCTGLPLEVPARWGVFKDIYCAGNDSTFAFLEEVLDEVVALFPGPRIHIGGDEAPKVRWMSCPKCQRRIQEEGLADEQELQRWFIERMGRYLATKGKTIIGWDEILEGGLPEGAAVQSWRGMEGAAEAVHLGADVVVSPTSHCYLDYPLRSTDLEEAYSFNPLPDSLTHGPGRILGGEGNMWTEHAPQHLVESKVYPRLTALAEVYWSGPGHTMRDGAYGDFLARLDHHYQRMDALGIEYGLESPPFRLDTEPSTEKGVQAKVVALGRGVEGRGQWSGRGADSLRTDQPFVVKGPGLVQMEVGRRGQWTDQRITFPLDGHDAAFRPLTLSFVPSPWYTGGGDGALVDGKLGSKDFRDGTWQAQQGQEMAATVDLGGLEKVAELELGTYLYQDAWIFLPAVVSWEGSTDGMKWESLARIAVGDVLARDDRQERISLSAKVRPGSSAARYVRMTVSNAGPCPDWHAAAGSESWLFLDEMVVRTE